MSRSDAGEKRRGRETVRHREIKTKIEKKREMNGFRKPFALSRTN